MSAGGNGIEGGTSSAPPVDALSIDRECLRHSHQNLIGVFFTVPIGASLLLYILSHEIGVTYILEWFVASMLWTGIRLWYYLAFRRHARGAFDPVFWGRLQTLLTVSAGFIWGVVPLVAYPADSISEQVFVALMLGGMAAGGTFAYAAMPRTAQLYLAAVCIPIAVKNLAMGSVEHFPVGIMLVIYYLMLVIITRNNARTVRSAITLSIENAALAAEMGKARDVAESAADRLRVESIEREKAKNEMASIMDAQPDILYVINPQGLLIKWNSALQKLCGLTRGQMMGRPAAEFVHEEDRPTVYAGIKEVFEKGSASIEVRFIRHDGALVPHLCNGAVWRDPDGEPLGFIGVGKDITELKKAEEALRESEGRYRQLSEASFEGVAITVEGKIADCNTAFARKFGYALEEIIGRTPLELVPPESYAIVADHIGRGSEERYEAVGLKKDGTLFPIEVQGRGTVFRGQKARVTSIRDMTERKRMEAVLLESEARWRYALEGAGDGLWDWDMATNKTYFSPRWKSLVGFKEDEFENSYEAWDSHLHPEDKPKVLSTLQSYIDGKVSEYQVEFRMLCKDGSWKWIMARGSIISRDPGGKPLRMIGMHTDISFRKAAEDELRRSDENLRKAQEIAHIGNWHWDIVSNTLHWSDEIYRIFGFAPREFVATYEAFLAAVHSDDRAYVQQRVNDAVAKKSPYDIIHRIVTAGGERVVHEMGEVSYDAAGRAVSMVGTVQDVTEGKRAEQALREGEARYRQLSEASFEGIVIAIDGKILDCNSAFARMFGYEPEEIIGKIPVDLSPPESQAVIMDHIRRGSEEVYNVLGRKKDGKLFPMEMQGRVIFHNGQKARLTAVRDITAWVKAEQAVRESEEQLRVTFDNATSGMAFVALDGKFDRINAALCRMYGYEDQELLGKSFQDVTHPDDMNIGVEWLRAVARGEAEKLQVEKRYIRKDGGIIWCSVVASLIKDARGKPSHLFSHVIDITAHKKAEEAMRKNGQLLDAIVENMPSMIFLKRASDLRFELFNRAGEALLGHRREELLGRNDYDFFPKEQADFFITKDREALEKAGVTDIPEEPIQTPSGTRILHTRKIGLRDERGQPEYLLGISEDITIRKEAEKKIYQMSLFPKFNPGPIIRCDSNGLILMANSAALAVFGVEKLEGVNVQALIPDLGMIELAKIIRDNALVYFTAALNKGYFQFAIKGVSELGVMNFYGSDITARKEAEERLQAVKEALSKAQELAHLGSWELDIQTGKVTWSDESYRIFGLEPGKVELTHEVFMGLVHPEDRKAVQENLHKVLSGGLPHLEAEARMIRPDGQERVIFTNLEAITGKDGTPVKLIGANLDITERKAAENELRKAKEEAEEANKLKDKFVSLVSHDLKTPLSSMIGFLKLVRNDYGESANEGVKLILDRTVESGQAMVRLIEDLLTISRFKTGQLKLNRQFFDAEYLGVMVAGNYAHLAAQKGIEIENTIPVNSRIYGDKTLLAAAVQNLVTNAIKFCKSGDRITIYAGEGESPVICVRDNGPGIPPNLLADLFRFEKKTSTRGTAGETGTGFGLPLVKEIMQLHGGELSVESMPGKGCLFSLKLPYVRPKILLVDDDKNSRLLQIMQLREMKADIIEAENGRDALKMLETVRPDLVITDIQMPIMDGIELLKRIKGAPETKDIPVIVQSGEFGMEMRDAIFKFGGDDFVIKKIDKADFFPRVRRFIG